MMVDGQRACGYFVKIYTNFDKQKSAELNGSSSLSSAKCSRIARQFGESVMPCFYFHLTSKENKILDDRGKKLDTLTDAYAHARALIDKIVFHVGHDDADVWKVVISNDEDDTQMIVPFAVSHIVREQRRGIT
jgi:hypothetical protein